MFITLVIRIIVQGSVGDYSGQSFNSLWVNNYSVQVNNYGVGLPIAAKNADHWNVKQPLLALASLAPSAQVIGETGDFFRAMLRVRYSTRLFRLPTSAAIQEQVRHRF